MIQHELAVFFLPYYYWLDYSVDRVELSDAPLTVSLHLSDSIIVNNN